MCTLEILQRMSDINDDIVRLGIDRLLIIGQEDANQLRTLPNEEQQEGTMLPVVPQNIIQRMTDAFRKILSLFQIAGFNAYETGKDFIDSLKEIITGFPQFGRTRMGEDTRKLYERTKDELEKESQSAVVTSLISCKEILFED